VTAGTELKLTQNENGGNRGAALRLAEDEVHDPAAPDVRPDPAAVAEDIRGVAPCALEGIPRAAGGYPICRTRIISSITS
jgi:hypothetical protein